MSSEFVQAIEALGKEKGINSDILFQAVEEAVVSAYKRIMTVPRTYGWKCQNPPVSFTFLNSAESWNR